MRQCKKIARRGLIAAGHRAGLAWLIRRPAHRLVCPFYHLARAACPPWWGPRYRIKSPEELEADMDQWLRWGEPVALAEVLGWVRGERDCPHGFFLSFDDGYRELYEQVAPILRRKGVPASFFITSSLLDNAAVYFQDHLGLIGQAIETAGPTARAEAESCLQRVGMSWADLCACRQPQHPLIGQMSALLEVDSKAWLESEQPYVTTAQCRELLQAGFALGAHSIDHPLYAALSAEEQVRQTVVSMDSIANRFGLNYRAFAFPYGEFGVDRNFVPAMVKRGVAEVFFGTRGVVPDSRAPRMVQRLWCEDHDGSLDQHVTHALAESWVQGIGKKLKR